MEVTFIATATAGDEEMAERIERHRRARPAAWTTVEAPIELAAAVRDSPAQRFLVIDCLTLWVSNLLHAEVAADEVIHVAEDVVAALAGRSGVVVSNEVGMGIVPVGKLSRDYVDLLGAVNSRFAARAERSVLMVAGMAVTLHPA